MNRPEAMVHSQDAVTKLLHEAASISVPFRAKGFTEIFQESSALSGAYQGHPGTFHSNLNGVENTKSQSWPSASEPGNKPFRQGLALIVEKTNPSGSE